MKWASTSFSHAPLTRIWSHKHSQLQVKRGNVSLYVKEDRKTSLLATHHRPELGTEALPFIRVRNLCLLHFFPLRFLGAGSWSCLSLLNSKRIPKIMPVLPDVSSFVFCTQSLVIFPFYSPKVTSAVGTLKQDFTELDSLLAFDCQMTEHRKRGWGRGLKG